MHKIANTTVPAIHFMMISCEQEMEHNGMELFFIEIVNIYNWKYFRLFPIQKLRYCKVYFNNSSRQKWIIEKAIKDLQYVCYCFKIEN